MNIFSFNSSDPAVKSLLQWKVGGEEEKWALRAVESLVKKLRKKNGTSGTVEDLEFALQNPLRVSKCVTIPRSMDGRLQVSHRKNLPHVIYCKLWRWPNVQSHHELRPVSGCRFPYDSRSEQICINPYHYQRTEQPTPMIMRAPSTSSSMVPDYYPRESPMGSYISPSSSGSESELGMSSNRMQPLGMMGPMSSMGMSMESQDEMRQHSPFSAYGYNSPVQRQPLAVSPSARSDDNDETERKLSTPPFTPPYAPFKPSENDANIWCTITYYELNSRIGEPFKMSSNSVTVDGFTNPSTTPDRICLGLLSNVNRNQTTENTRRHIGQGVEFLCDEQFVTVRNKSMSTFFVQSGNASFKLGQQAYTVNRIPTNGEMVLFDFQLFNNMLDNATRENNYHSVFELHKMCFIRMSFVKGWGQNYHRQEVTSTPCWIEMQLHRPLVAVDQVICRMQPPDHFLTNST